MNKLRDNPWGLTPAEAKAFDAMCSAFCHKRAAAQIGLSAKTVADHLRAGGRKMKVSSGDRLQKYLLWDRFRRAQTPENAMHLISKDGSTPVSADTVERAFS